MAPRPRLLFALVLLSLALSAIGCAGVTAATLGTVAGVAASAVGTGRDIYQLGKLDTVGMSTLVDTVAAAREAAEDLHLRLTCHDQEADRTTHLEFADDKCATVKVRLEPRTRTLVRIRINVGFFGSEPTARLFLARLRAHLPDDAAPVPKATVP